MPDLHPRQCSPRLRTKNLSSPELLSPPMVGGDLLEFYTSGIFLLLIGWFNPSSRQFLDDLHCCVQYYIGNDACDQTISDTVRGRHFRNGNEGWDCIAIVTPIDIGCRFSHQGSNDDECASSGPWRDGCKNWGKENGNEECDSCEDGCEASLASFGNTRSALSICSDWRGPKKWKPGFP